MAKTSGTKKRQVEYRPVAELIPYAKNSRTHSDSQVAQIAASIREFGWTNPILIDEQGGVIAGHGRLLAAQQLGETTAPCIVVDGLTDAQRRALVIADNKLALNAGWDEGLLASELAGLKDDGFDLGLLGFGDDEISALLDDGDAAAERAAGLGALADRFLVPPFSVLNAREGWWQDRKRQWLGLGIKSELGRGDVANSGASLTAQVNRAAQVRGRYSRGSNSVLEPIGKGDMLARHRKNYAAIGGAPLPLDRGKARTFGQDSMRGEGTNVLPGNPSPTDEDQLQSTGTSIFDPVLCEIAYRWFSPVGGVVIDPFAGGSVRGIVAAALGRRYIGMELRPEQVKANQVQWPAVKARLPIGTGSTDPAWHQGDSAKGMPDLQVDGGADFLFSCPPYGNLEVYSDDPADISAMPAKAFDQAYAAIIAAAAAKLNDHRFACFVVGDYRDKRGAYANFVSKTIAAFEAAGLQLYNEAILITAVGSLPIRAGKQFASSRKLGKTHQNVLVFVKGDWKKAVKACGPVEIDADAFEGLELPEAA